MQRQSVWMVSLVIAFVWTLALAVGAGEIVVKGNGQNIANGDSSPTRADNTDYASRPVGDARSLSYIIENTDSSNLTLGAVTISGSHAADFAVTDQPNSVLGSGTTWNGRDPSTTMQITFTPSGAGVRTATVSIPNDDADESPFTFDIQGLGTLGDTPDIHVIGGGEAVYHNDDIPSSSNDTDWEETLVGSSVETTFTLKNEGTADLNLSGGASVSVSGSAAFSVKAQPTTPVASGVSTSFKIAFAPTSRGEVEATVSIASDDPDEDPYVFAIKGTGASPEINIKGNGQSIENGDAAPEAADHTDFGAVRLDNDSLDRTFAIENTGDADLELDGSPIVQIGGDDSDFTVVWGPAEHIRVGGAAQTFTIRFDPTQYGVRKATVTIQNNDLDEDPYTFAIQGTVGPDIHVRGNGQTIELGDSNPSSADHTDFGSTPVDGGDDIIRTFTIENVGNEDLELGEGNPKVEISGDTGDFAVTALPLSPVSPNTSVTFDITFDPVAPGTRSATVKVQSDDADEPIYHFAIQGDGAIPDIDVQRDGGAPETDFGAVDYVAGHVTHTFTILNVGEANLVLDGAPCVALAGTPVNDFEVLAQPDVTILPNQSKTFQIRFDPSSIGDRTFTVSIDSNDPDEDPFTFLIVGEGAGPDMSMEGNGTVIGDGDVLPSTTDDTDFGDADIENDVVDHTFTIRNAGDGTLQLMGDPHIEITGPNADEFVVQQQPADEIAPNDPDVTFVIRFDPVAEGQREATVEIGSNDPNHKEYTFDIQGMGTVFPEIIVHGDGFEIVDGDTTPAVEDNTYFGRSDIGGQTVVHQFTVGNEGSGDLQVGPPAASVDNPAFTVSQQPAKIVNPHTRVAFEITFDPDVVGDAVGTVTIHSDDDDENPYTFRVEGEGTTRPPAVGGGGNSTPVPDAGPNQSAPTGFPVTLNGTLSFDADLGPRSVAPTATAPRAQSGLAYQWDFAVLYYNAGNPVYRLPDGSKARLTATNFDQAIASFIPDVPGEYVFTLTVTDDRGSWAMDQVMVTAYYDPDYQSSSDPVIVNEEDPILVSPIPFSDIVTFSYQEEGVPDVFWVAVFDLAGHRVWEAIEDRSREIEWDGTDDQGQPLPNGAYIYVVRILEDGAPFIERGTLIVLQ